MDNKNQDPYFKKIISFKHEKEKLNFKVSQELFSSQVIDYGTQRLLRTISTQNLGRFNKMLDLGCGYGPIGISLKKLNPKGEVHMVDKDALALEYSKQNAELNGVPDIKIYGSLGLDDIKDDDFDLIISNIPAKVGDKVLSHMLIDARQYIKEDGLVAVVVIDAITEYTKSALQSNEDIDILFEKSWPGHTVFHYRFNNNKKLEVPASGFERGIYDRTIKKFQVNSKSFSINTTYNLSEFDTLSFETELLLQNLKAIKKYDIRKAAVINPGQGYIPVALSATTKLDKIILIDRDLQALRVSERSLIQNNFLKENIILLHLVGFTIGENVDLIAGVIPDKQENKVYEMIINQTSQQLAPSGLVLFTSNSNVIRKLEQIIRSKKNLTIVHSAKHKGKKVILAKKKIA